jgi:hypothetical protein
MKAVHSSGTLIYRKKTTPYKNTEDHCVKSHKAVDTSNIT